MQKIINNLNQLQSLAKKITKTLSPGDIICLIGELGAGKTTFTQFLAKELGVKEFVNSPTFNIVKTYDCNLGVLNHIDAYRLEKIKNKDMFNDFIYHDGITIIEWAQYLEINKKFKKIEIKIINKNSRKVELHGFNI